MRKPDGPLPAARRRLVLSMAALSQWTWRQWAIAAAWAAAVALLLGFATVLIPNEVFSREIPPTPWSYPTWITTSVLSGMLMATYARPPGRETPAGRLAGRGSRWGITGGFLAWFAIGCPVCNKIALLALGYSGAVAYFAPLQPWLAAVALVSTIIALAYRLSGQIECAIPQRQAGHLERVDR